MPGRNKVEGVVSDVLLSPGSPFLNIRINDDGHTWHILHANSGRVTADGKACGPNELLVWLAANRCRVTMWEETHLYGAAVEAAFTALGAS
jgi:hypothetical protein